MRPSAHRAAVLAAVVLAACHGATPAAAPIPAPAPGASSAAAAVRSTAGASASAGVSATAGASAPGRDTTPAGTAGTVATTGELTTLMRARNDSALRRFTPADVQFMTMMIGHHTQAITMSRMAESHGARESVRTLASRIINAQRDEIATMQQWLRDRGQPVPDPAAAHDMASHDMAGHDMSGHDMAAMPGMAGGSAAGDHAMMPGMLTPPQMAALDAARGAEFDRLFLTGMIQHHRGAVSMVQQLFGSYGAGQDEAVFKFASDVNVDQTTEIARMERMLATVLFAPDAPTR